MSTKIRVVAVVASAATLTGGVVYASHASTRITKTSTITRAAVAAPNGVNDPAAPQRGPKQTLTNVLADLVKKGTINQSQADAISKAVDDVEAAEHANDPRGPRDGFRGMMRPKLDIAAKTLGIDTATILSRLKAGESLATIAGDKKSALISALVADETKRIDDAVTAGKLTAAQATTMKAGLVAAVTAAVEATPGSAPMGMRDGDGDGRGPKMGRGHGPMMGGSAPALPGALTGSKN